MPKSRMSRSSLLRRIAPWVIEIAAVCVLSGIAWGYVVSVKRETLDRVGKAIATRQTASVVELESWMDDRVKQVNEWAVRPDTLALARLLLAVKNPTPEQLAKLPQQAAFRSEFTAVQAYQGVLGYFLVSPEGVNLAALGNGNIGQTNLLWEEQEFREQMRVLGAALSPLMTSDVPLENVGVSLDGKPLTVLVGVPIYLDSREPAAYFMLRLPTVGLLAQQGQARFQQGGGSYMADRFGRLHADRVWLNLDLARHGLTSERFRGHPHLFARDPGFNLLIDMPRRDVDRGTLPLTRSVLGLRSGSGSTLNPYNDHRGVQVVGSWTWSSKLGLGVVTEIPAAEAFAPIARAHQRVLVAAILVGAALVGALLLRLQRSRRRLKSALINAEAAGRAKGAFLANMSHEIRTPLNAVLGIAHLLGTTPLTAPQREYLRIISTSGKGLLDILNDILDYSKVEAGKLELLAVEFSMHELIDTLASMMAVNAAPKDLEFVIGVDADVPSQLIGDSHRLLQVLVNLVGNAIKFSAEGEVALRVSRVSEQGDELRVRFEVSDCGVGIPAAKQAQLFSPFTQADAGTARNFGGTGLGLAICKRLVELMRGQIGVHSVEGQGSNFWFEVPLTAAARKEDLAVAPQGAVRHAMVVDDNSVARDFVAKSLLRMGWQAVDVASGPAAISELLARQREASGTPFDLILVDWNMPGMDGLQASKAIRSLQGFQAPPIVLMVTAFGREQVLQSPDADGIDAVISKPATPSKIVDALMEAQAKRSGGYQAQRSSYVPARVVNRLKGLRILLVEDNYINQQVARGVLVAEGAVVSAVDHGAMALDVLNRQADDFDIVLMDVQMPVMDGIEATRRLRSPPMNFRLPIIAMSAGVTEEERDLCQMAGMNGFIAKPLEPQLVIKVIRDFDLRSRPQPEQPTPEPDVRHGDEVSLPIIDGVDVDDLYALLNDNLDSMYRLLDRLAADCGSTLDDIDRALSNDNFSRVSALLHGFKGITANMRAKRVSAQVEELEDRLRADDKAGFRARYPAFREGVTALKNALEALHVH